MHCDTIMHFYDGEHLNGMEGTHINLEKLVQGNCLAQCFAIFIPTNEAAEHHGITDSPEEYFDKAYAEGALAGVFGTNLTYRTPELLSRPWFYEVDMAKYVSYFVASLNHDMSISIILDPHEKIKRLLSAREGK